MWPFVETSLTHLNWQSEITHKNMENLKVLKILKVWLISRLIDDPNFGFL